LNDSSYMESKIGKIIIFISKLPTRHHVPLTY